jgi:hypothetical protein
MRFGSINLVFRKPISVKITLFHYSGEFRFAAKGKHKYLGFACRHHGIKHVLGG